MECGGGSLSDQCVNPPAQPLCLPPPSLSPAGTLEAQVHWSWTEGCRRGLMSLGLGLSLAPPSPSHVVVCTSSCLRGGWACSRGLMICAIIYSFARRETH